MRSVQISNGFRLIEIEPGAFAAHSDAVELEYRATSLIGFVKQCETTFTFELLLQADAGHATLKHLGEHDLLAVAAQFPIILRHVVILDDGLSTAEITTDTLRRMIG